MKYLSLRQLTWLVFALTILSVSNLQAQSAPFLRVNNDSISLQEFRSLYAANIEAEGFDQAVNTYIDFQLLYDKARSMRVDTTQYYQKIFDQVSFEMKKARLALPQMEDSLVHVIMENQKREHQLKLYGFDVPNPFNKNAKMQTENLAKAYWQQVCGNRNAKNKAVKDTVIAKWYRSPHLPHDVEEVAYGLSANQCSSLQYTDRGYFFVQYLQSRPTLGAIQFAQIVAGSREKIDLAYSRLQAGTSFMDVAVHFSEDPKVRENFGVQPTVDFYLPQAYHKQFSDLKIGEYSQPFQFNDQWVIVRLLQQDNCQDNPQCYDKTKQNLSRSQYVQLLQKAQAEVAKKNVQYRWNDKNVQQVRNLVKNNIENEVNNYQFPTELKVVEFAQTAVTQQQLYNDLMMSLQRLGQVTDYEAFFDAYIPIWKDMIIQREFEQNLELHLADHREEIQTFGRALMVNYFMETEIAQKAQQDSAGLNQWLKENQQRFTYPTRFETEIYRFQGEQLGQSIETALRKGESYQDIRKRFVAEAQATQPTFIANTGLSIPGQMDFPSHFDFRKKLQQIEYRGMQAWVRIVRELPPTPMKVEEAGEALVVDYTSVYHERVLEKLREEAQIQRPENFR